MKPRYYGAIALFGIGLCIWGLALAQTSRTATLHWSAVTQTVAGDPVTGAITYNVYQGAKGSTSKAKVKTGVSPLTFAVTGLPVGETCFNVSAQTAVNAEGGLSSEACKSFSPDPTATVQSLTVD